MAERELLLWRHGLAAERRPDRSDAERALTAAGLQRTRVVAGELVRLGLTCDAMLSSPLRRAVQTAALGVAAGLAESFAVAAALAPEGDPTPLLEPGPWRRLALVGHEPDLGDLACRLLGAPPGTISLRKAGVALLRLGVGQARLQLLIGPRFLDRG